MKRLLPWIGCAVFGIGCLVLVLEVQRLRAALGAATVETADRDGVASAQAVAPPEPSPQKDEIAADEQNELLKLRNAVHQLRDSNQELVAKVKEQEGHLKAAKTMQQGPVVFNEAFTRMQDEILRKTGMIGAAFINTNNQPTVRAVAEDSPAVRAGIKPGDHVLSVDGKNAAEMSFDEMIDAIRGDEGTQLILEIEDGKTNGRRQVTLVREKVKSANIWVEAPSRNSPD